MLEGINFADPQGIDVVGPVKVNKSGEPNKCMSRTEDFLKSKGTFIGLNPVEYEEGEQIFTLKGKELHPGFYKIIYKSKPYVVEIAYQEGYSRARIVKGGTAWDRVELTSKIRKELGLSSEYHGKDCKE